MLSGLNALPLRRDFRSLVIRAMGSGEDPAWLTNVSGVDTITARAKEVTVLRNGMQFSFVSAGANTGAATLNINALGAVAVTKGGSTALAAGDIPSGALVRVVYDGTRFQMVGSLVGGTAAYTNITIGSLAVVGTGDATAGATAGSVRAPNKTGSNAAGVNFTIKAGNGTGTGGSGAITFETAPIAASSSTANTMAEVGRFTSGGAFLVGGTAVSAKLRVDKSSADGLWMIQGYTDGVERIRIDNAGSILNSLNSYGSLSDRKLKEDISDATPKLADVMRVRVVNYRLKGSQEKQIGVIAQEIEQVFPSLVTESPDKDDDGNILGTTTKAVKYSVLIPILLKAVQELKNELDDVKAQLAALQP